LITATTSTATALTGAALPLLTLALNGGLALLSLLRLRSLSTQQEGHGRYNNERQHES
jgi:hypothetical protein